MPYTRKKRGRGENIEIGGKAQAPRITANYEEKIIREEKERSWKEASLHLKFSTMPDEGGIIVLKKLCQPSKEKVAKEGMPRRTPNNLSPA